MITYARSTTVSCNASSHRDREIEITPFAAFTIFMLKCWVLVTSRVLYTSHFIGLMFMSDRGALRLTLHPIRLVMVLLLALYYQGCPCGV